jgi:tetratricopeptide (TPR) repeat protein
LAAKFTDLDCNFKTKELNLKQPGLEIPLTIMNVYTNNKKGFNHRYGIAICLFLIFVTLAVFWQVGSFDFDNYDSADYVYENRHVKAGVTADSLRWAFTTTHASNWHPVTWLSHMLDVQIFGLNPGAHHWTSVVFHLSNVLLLFLILHRMTGYIWRSAFVAALFAIHPLHVESVAWIAQRKDLLSTFFCLLAIWAYVRYARFPTVGRFMPVLLFFILSLMAKPMMVTLPFVLLLLDYWPLGRISFGFKPQASSLSQHTGLKAGLILEKLPLLVASAASCVVTVYAQQAGGAVGSLAAYPLMVRIANALVAYLGYIGKMFWPTNLAVIYPHPGMPPEWRSMIAGILLAGITGLALKFAKSKPWFIVGWLWFLGTLVPVIGLVQVGTQAIADRYTYMPLIGLFIMLAWAGPDLLKRFRYQKVGLAVITTLVTIVLTIVSWGQVKTWQSSVTLFERALAVTKGNYVAHHNIGQYHLKAGRLSEAIDHFTNAVEINPKFELAHLSLGVALSRQGKIDDAIRFYTRALALKPDYVLAYNNLGNARYRQGKYREAISHYLQAIQIDPDYAEAYNGIGAALIRLGETDKALVFFKKALKINPDHTAAQNNLKNTLAATQKKPDTGRK